MVVNSVYSITTASKPKTVVFLVCMNRYTKEYPLRFNSDAKQHFYIGQLLMIIVNKFSFCKQPLSI